MKYLGVDGGGTKTAFILMDDSIGVIGYLERESCHYRQVGLEKFGEIIEEGIDKLCKEAHVNKEVISYGFLGLPGYGESKKAMEDMENIIGKILKAGTFKCGNDVEAGWAGSLACNPGINIVAGTGAIAMGKDRMGNIARSSGWGPFCGDEGSAYWIGKKTIEVFTKEADGRLEKTPLYEIMKNDLSLKDDYQIIELLVDKYKMDREKIARLALVLFKAAEAKDVYAEKIYNEAAQEYVLMAKAIINQLDFQCEDEILISYSGGAFKGEKYILGTFEEGLRTLNVNCKLIKPIIKPIIGAALYGMKLHQGTVNSEFVERLKSYEIK